MRAFLPARTHAPTPIRPFSPPTRKPPNPAPPLHFPYDLGRMALHAPVIVEEHPGAQKGPRSMPRDAAPTPEDSTAANPQKDEPTPQPAQNKPLLVSTVPAQIAPTHPAPTRPAAHAVPAAVQASIPARRPASAAPPRALSLSAMQTLPHDQGLLITGPPVTATLSFVDSHSIKNAAGFTDWPAGYTAPAFDYNSTPRFNTSRAPFIDKDRKNYSRPTKKAAAFEGTSGSWYTGPGKYATGDKEGGKDVYWNFSAAASDIVKTGEQEHCDDFAEAYRISLKEVDDVLTANVYGKDFGPSATPEAAEQLVRDTIAAKLTHAQNGTDQAQWANKYITLCYKTATRDTSAWHSISTGTRTEAGSTVTYEIVKGSAQIPGPASNTIIKY